MSDQINTFDNFINQAFDQYEIETTHEQMKLFRNKRFWYNFKHFSWNSFNIWYVSTVVVGLITTFAVFFTNLQMQITNNKNQGLCVVHDTHELFVNSNIFYTFASNKAINKESICRETNTKSIVDNNNQKNLSKNIPIANIDSSNVDSDTIRTVVVKKIVKRIRILVKDSIKVKLNNP